VESYGYGAYDTIDECQQALAGPVGCLSVVADTSQSVPQPVVQADSTPEDQGKKCEMLTESECRSKHGQFATWMGEDTTCDPDPCNEEEPPGEPTGPVPPLPDQQSAWYCGTGPNVQTGAPQEYYKVKTFLEEAGTMVDMGTCLRFSFESINNTSVGDNSVLQSGPYATLSECVRNIMDRNCGDFSGPQPQVPTARANWWCRDDGDRGGPICHGFSLYDDDMNSSGPVSNIYEEHFDPLTLDPTGPPTVDGVPLEVGQSLPAGVWLRGPHEYYGQCMSNCEYFFTWDNSMYPDFISNRGPRGPEPPWVPGFEV
tara:strand:- start:15368 stop:16306 length:939 start_codon:yes stop_codon:yes gene_type:complete